MKTVIKSHMLAVGLIAGSAMLIIIFGLTLSGTLYWVIGRKAGEKFQSEAINGD